MIIEGSIAIKAAIKGKKREINAVYIDRNKKTKDFSYIRHLCKDNNIHIKDTGREEIDAMAVGKSHGGIVADVSMRLFQNIDEMLECEDLFYIDGIEDPFNLGYVYRTLFAFGFKNIIIPSRNTDLFESTLLKSSAGAYDFMNIYMTDDLLNDIEYFGLHGYKTYALERGDKSKDIFDYRFKGKSLFLIGGEKRGIASKIIDKVDELLYIPYGSDFKMALSAASTVDVLASLVYKGNRR